MKTEKRILDNNVVLITQESEKSGCVSVGFWFSTGSAYENDDEHGLSHFTEHMIFKGTQSRTTRDISVAFDRIGGYINAWTEKENVCLCATVPSGEKNLGETLDILCDMSENCTFPQEEFDKEKSVIINEVLSTQDDFDESSCEAVSAFVWEKSPLSFPIAGTVDEVESVSRDMVVSWYRKYFSAGELCVVVAGNFDADSVASRLCSLSRRKEIDPVNHPEIHKDAGFREGTFFRKAPFSQCQIFDLFPYSVPLTEREYLAGAVFNSIAGDSMSSRLFDSLREKKGLCYSVGSFWTYYECNAMWSANVVCEKKNASVTCAELQKEIRKLVTDGISEREVEFAKSHLCGEHIISGEDVEFLMKRLHFYYIFGWELDSVEETISIIESIGRDEVVRIAEEVVSGNRNALVGYGAKFRLKNRIDEL